MQDRIKAVRYIRVSGTDPSPRVQADKAARLILERGWQLVGTYSERSDPGSRADRPELTRLMTDARRGTFKVVVVWRSDRIFQSLRSMFATIEELLALGIDFVSTSEPFDTLARPFLSFVVALGEFERRVTAERTRAGLDAARRRGVRIGRPRIHVDVERAVELRAAGKSLRATARILGVGAATLHRALKSR